MWWTDIATWRQNIAGEWQAGLRGADLLELRPADRNGVLHLRPDGTWESHDSRPAIERSPELVAPFEATWELSDQRILSLWTPVAPMPEYDMPEWSREEKQYFVLSVSDASLGLADSHQVVVYRRIDCEEYDRRRADEYGQMLDWAREVGENPLSLG